MLVEHMLTVDALKWDVYRAFVLACSVEPLANKPGCTTRHVDASPGTKLEYFIVSAVNSAWPFLELIDRVVQQDGQPTSIFDIAYLAQQQSIRNRYGGKVNYAQIFMLLPIIAAQALLYVEGQSPFDVDLILGRTGRALRDTARKDVKYLQQFVDLSRELSELHHRRLGTTRSQLRPKFQGIYRNVMDALDAPEFSHMKMVKEVKAGYPRSKVVFERLSIEDDAGILRRSEVLYHELLPEMIRPDNVADSLVVGLYLTLVAKRDAILFP